MSREGDWARRVCTKRRPRGRGRGQGITQVRAHVAVLRRRHPLCTVLPPRTHTHEWNISEHLPQHNRLCSHSVQGGQGSCVPSKNPTVQYSIVCLTIHVVDSLQDVLEVGVAHVGDDLHVGPGNGGGQPARQVEVSISMSGEQAAAAGDTLSGLRHAGGM